jgi:hypothetical protein
MTFNNDFLMRFLWTDFYEVLRNTVQLFRERFYMIFNIDQLYELSYNSDFTFTHENYIIKGFAVHIISDKKF